MRMLAAALLLALLVLQGRLWFGDGSIPSGWRLSREVAEQQAENAALEERNRALAADVADLKSGLEAVEERARRELGMIGEAERFYQVVEQDAR
ncbi:cell division protein FtsB [Sediminicurvatus halobius]|uniref:Cell division protein FtsB n=1 Tax=Sediminicurvatus halobius TaxID=2182432 RepID=A0A2U2N417_9GAMM|nr:cell division protein FtsB [Spiribacter halobius]PWG63926.1 cell division protein FtsB [Spiribacter halobius]UEX76339.1 cell division protein FtsB [Spiribacter halobius]